MVKYTDKPTKNGAKKPKSKKPKIQAKGNSANLTLHEFTIPNTRMGDIIIKK